MVNTAPFYEDFQADTVYEVVQGSFAYIDLPLPIDPDVEDVVSTSIRINP